MVGMTAIGVTLLMCISGCQKDAVEITGGYPVSEKEAKTEESEGIENKEKYVYICGAVMNAGVYEITEETRICEVVKMAGGFDEDADEDSVNLAAFAIDGEQIRIPYIGENLHIGEEDLIDLNEASSNDLCAFFFGCLIRNAGKHLFRDIFHLLHQRHREPRTRQFLIHRH